MTNRDPRGSLVTGRTSGETMERITSVNELPSRKALVALVKKAAKLNEEGVKVPRARKIAAKKTAAMPDDLAASLKKNKTANASGSPVRKRARRASAGSFRPSNESPRGSRATGST